MSMYVFRQYITLLFEQESSIQKYDTISCSISSNVMSITIEDSNHQEIRSTRDDSRWMRGSRS